MKIKVTALARAFLNLIYPIICPICHVKLAANTGLCETCLSTIHKNRSGLSACIYEGVLRKAVCLFKYKNTLSLLKVFSRLLLDFMEKRIDMSGIDAIIPIPLYHVKLRERGFNQARLLCGAISKKYGIPVLSGALIKVKPTAPQRTLNRNMRMKNLNTAFAVKKSRLVKEKHILLVDDIYTTGATIATASRALKMAGAASIKAVTLAGGA